MAKLKFSGPVSMRARSFLKLNQIALATYARHTMGRKMAPDWDAALEIGVLFWRHQFTKALACSDMAQGRLIFDSVLTETDDVYDVEVVPCDTPLGAWYHPATRKTDSTVLHFHGGGYTFFGEVSKRYAAMIAHHTGASVFAPDYRLTPEHIHPAQAEDALAAWRYVTQQISAESIVVTGDSAGGHMALMLLQTLKAEGLEQPALCIGLCPWTDIGDRGASLRTNDHYDLVQGWMALQFGRWLDPDGRFGREALSPIFHDYAGLAPIYLQAGGREVLHDMIVEFAQVQKAKGAEVSCDVWPDMPHEFQAYDALKSSSSEALEKLARAVKTRAAP